MKNFTQLAILGALLAASASCAHADPITFSTVQGGLRGTLPDGNPNRGIITNKDRADDDLGFGPVRSIGTGDVYFEARSPRADDTADVILTDILPSNRLGLVIHCADTRGTCPVAAAFLLNEFARYSRPEADMFTFVVTHPSGGASAIPALVQVVAPEPRSLLLFATGLLGIVPIFFFRRERVAASA